MAKPAVMRKTVGLLVTVLLLSMLMPAMAFAEDSLSDEIEATELKNEFASKTNVEITVKGDTAIVPVSALIDAAKKYDDAAVTIKSENGTIVLPLSVFDFEALAKQLGGAAADLKINVEIKKLSGDAAKPVDSAVAAVGGNALAAAVDFGITVEGKDGKKVAIDSFGKTYVEHKLPLTAKPSKTATVALYNPATQTLNFVPASISDTEAVFWRTGNGIYTVVEFSKTFSDIASHWAKADIEQLAGKLIVDGVTDTTFEADRNITRAEFAALAVRSLGLNTVTGATYFHDVKSDDWFAGVVGAAAQAGIVNGYEDGTFRPNALITREELAAMVVRAFEFADGNVAIDAAGQSRLLSKWSDADKIVWGHREVAIALAAGLMNGMTATTLETYGQATRAQSAAMLKRFLSDIEFID